MRASISIVTVFCVIASFTTGATNRDTNTADVTVYKTSTSAETTYNYSLKNLGEHPIVAFSIGYDYYHGTPELTGDRPTAIQSPNGWAGRIISLEESNNYQVRWERIDDQSIDPGETMPGFVILTSHESTQFLNSHWTTTISGPPTSASSLLRAVDAPQGDTVAPTISVSVNPNILWPPDGKMTTISATIAVHDNFDPNPSVRLKAITCNECENLTDDVTDADFGTDDRTFLVKARRDGQRKEGRVYTVTYSASDFSGNTATASALINVPHDQKALHSTDDTP